MYEVGQQARVTRDVIRGPGAPLGPISAIEGDVGFIIEQSGPYFRLRIGFDKTIWIHNTYLEGVAMKREYKYNIGQEVVYRGKVVKVTEREKNQFSGTPYYKVDNLGAWVKEENVSHYEPLADWEKALLEGARKFEIGARVQMTGSRKPGTVVDYDDRSFPMYPGVKWDDMTHPMHYKPEHLEAYVPLAVEQIEGDDPRLEEFWKKAEARARELGFCREYDLIAEELQKSAPKMTTTNMKIQIPVEVYVTVEHEVGTKPTREQVISTFNSMRVNARRGAISAAALSGNYDIRGYL